MQPKIKIAWNKGLKYSLWKRPLNCVCLTCGVFFHRKPSKLLAGRGKYCSRKCKAPADTQRFLGEKNPRWNDGKINNHSGYVLLKAANHPFANNQGYVAEHRLIMEKIVGRYLNPEEKVHHLNGIKNDNRPENLELFETQSAHIKTYHKEKGGAGFHGV